MTKKSIILILVLFCCCACEDWLNLEPQDSIVKENFWKTKEQAYAALIGCYSTLLNSDLSYKMFIWGELRADFITPTSRATTEEQDIVNGNILETNSIVRWAAFYNTINNCNTLIKNAPLVRQNDPTFEESAMLQYMAEARAIRSLLYFYLVRSFKEVPFTLDAIDNDDQQLAIAKSSEEDILQGILNDLKEAEKHALHQLETNAKSKGRFTTYGINALQADVYLWRGDYDSCIAYADKVINSGKYDLVETNAWYNSLFNIGNSTEGIFEIQFATVRHPLYTIIRNGRKFTAPAYVLDEYYTVDYVNTENMDVRGLNSSVTGEGNIWKYLGATLSTSRSDEAPWPNWIVYRLADVLLMKAEALAQLDGSGQEALDLIEEIRTRANALEATEEAPAPDDKQGITAYILHERAREFAYEGKRWYDVLRIARRNDYAQFNLLTDVVVHGAPADKQQGILTKYKDHNSHYLPIHYMELQNNDKLEQNPFYATY